MKSKQKTIKQDPREGLMAGVLQQQDPLKQIGGLVALVSGLQNLGLAQDQQANTEAQLAEQVRMGNARLANDTTQQNDTRAYQAGMLGLERARQDLAAADRQTHATERAQDIAWRDKQFAEAQKGSALDDFIKLATMNAGRDQFGYPNRVPINTASLNTLSENAGLYGLLGQLLQPRGQGNPITNPMNDPTLDPNTVNNFFNNRR